MVAVGEDASTFHAEDVLKSALAEESERPWNIRRWYPFCTEYSFFKRNAEDITQVVQVKAIITDNKAYF